MKRWWNLVTIGLVLGGICGFSAQANGSEPSEATKTLLFVGYPDGSNWLMADMFRRLGRAYESNNPNVTIMLKPRTGYKEARPAVLKQKAAGMMISEEINKIRAYVTTVQQGRAFGRGYARELKLNRFLPIAVRTIRNQDGEIAARMRFGIVTDRISEELNEFLKFLETDAAEKALAEIPDMKPAEPAENPTRVTKIHATQNFRWKEAKKLPQPILVY